MQKSSAPNSSFDSDAPGGAEDGVPPVAGDADAVEKTTYVVGKGTDDRADRLDPTERADGDERDGLVEDDSHRDPPPRRGTGPWGG